MRIRFWGTRGTRPTPGPRTLRYGGNTACVEVLSASGDVLVIDSGSGIAELGSAVGHGSAFDAHLLITHTHWDHIQGFPFFAPNFVHESRLTVVGPTGSSQSLQEAFTDQMRPSYFPMTLGEIPADVEFIECSADVEFEICGMTVTPKSLDHPIATFGYRIEEMGKSFVFATDNEIRAGGLRESLVEWCSGADLLVHDAQYSEEEYRTRVGWGHSTFDAALELARAAEVKQLAFFHHDPDHSDSEIDRYAEEAMRRAGVGVVAFAAAECQEITL